MSRPISLVIFDTSNPFPSKNQSTMLFPVIPSVLLLGAVTNAATMPRRTPPFSPQHKRATTTTSAWPFSNDQTVYPAHEELPPDVDTYTAYTKIMASTRNETLTWFYNGFSTATGTDLPEVCTYGSQTCEAFKVTHLSNDSLRIDWIEAIQLSDSVTQKPITEFTNPLTAITFPVETYEFNAASTWWFTRNGTGADLRVTYAGTGDVDKAHIKANIYNNQAIITNYEETGSSDAPTVTTFVPIGLLADVRNASITSVRSIGSYYAWFGNESIDSLLGYPNGTIGETHIIGAINKGNEFGWVLDW